MFLDGEHGIEKAFDFSLAMIELVLGDALSMNADLVDHALGSVMVVSVVLEEVGMPEDVRRDKSILQEVIHLHQKSIARVGVDHHLVDLAQSEIILHLLPVIGFPVCPVAEPPRQTVGGEFVHDSCWHKLEVSGEGVQSEVASLFPGMVYCITQAFDIAIGHSKLLHRGIPCGSAHVNASQKPRYLVGTGSRWAKNFRRAG